MSTRRARIKAVASLPVRRKNAETKPAPSPKLSTSPRVHKSPRTQRPPASPCASPRTFTSNKTPVFVSCNEPYNQSLIPPSPKRVPLSPQLDPPSPQFVVPSPQRHPSSPQQNVSVPQGIRPSPKVIVPEILPPSPKRSRNISCSATTPQSFILRNILMSPALPPGAKSRKSALEENEGVSTPAELGNTPPQRAESRTSPLNETPKSDKLSLPAETITNTFRQYRIEASKPPKLSNLVGDGIDGIVPLQAPAPRPVHLLKDEIISETAEVVFDPIVPLPSPTRIRPKLRPTPRLGYPHRRNSVQGSASESEDERGKMPKTATSSQHSTYSSRDRTESVCSVAASPAVTPAPHPATPAPGIPASAIMHTHSVRRDKMAGGAGGAGAGHSTQAASTGGMRRRVRPRAAPGQPVTMYDLIFYNPITNPLVEEKEVEEEVKEMKFEETESSGGVPQLKLGPNGEIVLDEKSLVIENRSSACKLGRSVGGWGAGAGRYKRGPRSADWSDGETVRFYRALAALGTDFTLMASLFPNRSRKDLKLKFKKEERVNLRQVEAALAGGGAGMEAEGGEGGAGAGCAWDAARLMREFAEERRAALPPAPAPTAPQRRHARHAKMGLAGRSMLDTMLPTSEQCGTAAALVRDTRGGRTRRPRPRAPALHVTYKPADPAAPPAVAPGKVSIPVYDGRAPAGASASTRQLIPVISSQLLAEPSTRAGATQPPSTQPASTRAGTPSRPGRHGSTPGNSVIVTFAAGTFVSPRAPRVPPTPGSQPKPLRPVAASASATVPAWRRLVQGGAGGVGGVLGGLGGRVEPGSLVVLSAPTAPTTGANTPGGAGAGPASGAGGRTLLQTYVAGAGGALEPVALPPALLPSLLAYMRPHASPGPAALSPASTASTPRARVRNDSFTITHL